MLNSYSLKKIVVLFKEFIKRPHSNLQKNVIANFSDKLLVRPDNATNMFHINVIVVEQNIFSVWNILTQSILF